MEQLSKLEYTHLRKNQTNTYYEYTVTASFGNEKTKEYEVCRRFSQFEELLDLLRSNYPGAFLPHLPPKSLLKNTNINDDKSFIAERTRSLDLMMRKLLSHHSILGGSSPDTILAMFMDRNCELIQSSKVSKLTKSLVGSASLGYAKSKTYFKSWFGNADSSSTLKYEYGGKEPDDLKELKEILVQMKSSLDQVLHDIGVIYEETDNKCQALEEQARTLENMSDNESLLSFTKINPEFTLTLAQNHRKTKERTEIYMKCLKDYFIFYFKELMMDVEEAINRITDRLLKGDQIKSNIHNIQTQEEITNFWVAHRLNLEQLFTEVTLFREQFKESLNKLLQSYKAAKSAHESEILELWQNAPKKDVQRAETTLNESTSDKNISMATSP